jgi:hypothetical protein
MRPECDRYSWAAVRSAGLLVDLFNLISHGKLFPRSNRLVRTQPLVVAAA